MEVSESVRKRERNGMREGFMHKVRITPVLKFCGEWSQGSLWSGLDLLAFLSSAASLAVFCYVHTTYLCENLT